MRPQQLNSSIFTNIPCVVAHYAGLQNALHTVYRLIIAIPDQQVSLPCKTIFYVITKQCGPGSSVGIATAYGLDGPGIESRLGRDFPHQSRPALRPTQPPVQWVPGLSRGKVRPGRDADLSPPSSADV